MAEVIRKRVRVGAGGVVEICDPALVEGTEAEVIVFPEPGLHTSPDTTPPSLAEMVGAARGVFSSADEIDRYIRDLRDEWD